LDALADDCEFDGAGVLAAVLLAPLFEFDAGAEFAALFVFEG